MLPLLPPRLICTEVVDLILLRWRQTVEDFADAFDHLKRHVLENNVSHTARFQKTRLMCEWNGETHEQLGRKLPCQIECHGSCQRGSFTGYVLFFYSKADGEYFTRDKKRMSLTLKINLQKTERSPCSRTLRPSQCPTRRVEVSRPLFRSSLHK